MPSLNNLFKTYYPPRYTQKIWDYKNVHRQVGLFKRTLPNIFYNFIPSKIILPEMIRRTNWLFQSKKKSS